MWTYEQSTGQLYDPSGKFFNEGYSGYGVGLNNPLMQAVRDVGPIPIGLYMMGIPVDSPIHGPYAIPLIPDSTTDLFGRVDFMCHGERLKGPRFLASNGCVIQSPIEKRQEMYASGDRGFLVVDRLDG